MNTMLRPASRRAQVSGATRSVHPDASAVGGGAEPEVPATELDVRFRLPPPKPLPAILAAMEAIPAGRPQYVRTLDDPAALLAALAARGVAGQATRLADGTWRARLTRQS